MSVLGTPRSKRLKTDLIDLAQSRSRISRALGRLDEAVFDRQAVDDREA